MNGQLFRVRGIFRTVRGIDAFTGFIHYTGGVVGSRGCRTPDSDSFKRCIRYSDVLERTKQDMNTTEREILPGMALPDILNMIEVDKLANLLVNFILFTIVALGMNTMPECA